MTENHPEQLAEKAVQSFDLMDYVQDRATTPQDTVTVYLDAETAYEIEQLKARHDELTRKGEHQRQHATKEPRGITEGDEDAELLETIEDDLERLHDKIAESGLTFHLRAVGTREQEVIFEKIYRENALPKHATEEEKGIAEKNRNTLTEEAWLAAAVTRVVRDSDGAVDASKQTQEDMATFHTMLYSTEWEKLVNKFGELSYATALFERATDAGFRGRATVEAGESGPSDSTEGGGEV